MKKRLTSKVVWASILMQVILIIGAIIPSADIDVIKVVGLAIIEIFTLL